MNVLVLSQTPDGKLYGPDGVQLHAGPDNPALPSLLAIRYGSRRYAIRDDAAVVDTVVDTDEPEPKETP